MREQLSFPESDARPRPVDGWRRPKDGVFFAILPDTAAAMRAVELMRRLGGDYGLKGGSLKTNRLHVSLYGLGDYAGGPHGMIATAIEAAATIVAPPFDVAFDRVMSFRGARKRPLVLCGGDGLGALMAFQQTLKVAMAKAGLGRGARSRFTPHMTLAYDDGDVHELAVETIGWTVHELVLVHSLRGQGRYVPLARWPLRG
jgi:2'-5' RNA ligase